MKTFRTLFLILVTLISLFVSITGLLSAIDLASRVLLILFLPVTGYLVFVLVGHLAKKAPIFEQKSGLRRVVVYYCFILTASVVTLSFLSAQNTAQFVSSVIFSPMAVYFLLLVWPRRQEALTFSEGPRVAYRRLESKSLVTPKTRLDVDRRNFLKLLGSAGLLAVILGLFSRRGGIPPFLGNIEESLTLKDSSGKIINPAERSPTEGYNISQIDDSVPAYFGFTDRDGAWFIMKEREDGAYHYARGNFDFTKNWDNRAKLDYSTFDNVF